MSKKHSKACTVCKKKLPIGKFLKKYKTKKEVSELKTCADCRLKQKKRDARRVRGKSKGKPDPEYSRYAGPNIGRDEFLDLCDYCMFRDCIVNSSDMRMNTPREYPGCLIYETRREYGQDELNGLGKFAGEIQLSLIYRYEINFEKEQEALEADFPK